VARSYPKTTFHVEETTVNVIPAKGAFQKHPGMENPLTNPIRCANIIAR